MTKYIGIDPGVSGALVAINDQGSIIDVLLMPTYKEGTKSRVNGAAMATWLIQHTDAQSCFVEKVHAMPGQGVSSMFNFGHSLGVIHGVVLTLGLSMREVTPQSWKKHHGLIGTDKDAARTAAIKIYPKEVILNAKGKGQALADALLIARYGAGLK